MKDGNYNVLMYHHIGNISGKYNISKSKFIDQVDLIQKMNFQICGLEGIESQSTNKLCVFTFDDGFKSDLWAAEKLSEYGFSATFFMVKCFVGKDGNKYVSRNDIKKISELGHSIGVHGKLHTWWTKLSDQKLKEDLQEAKLFFEDLTGKKIISCSAPGGKLNKRVLKTIGETNLFKYVRNSVPTLNNSVNQFEINSFGITRNCSINEFSKIISSNQIYLKYLMSKYHMKEIVKNITGL